MSGRLSCDTAQYQRERERERELAICIIKIQNASTLIATVSFIFSRSSDDHESFSFFNLLYLLHRKREEQPLLLPDDLRNMKKTVVNNLYFLKIECVNTYFVSFHLSIPLC